MGKNLATTYCIPGVRVEDRQGRCLNNGASLVHQFHEHLKVELIVRGGAGIARTSKTRQYHN